MHLTALFLHWITAENVPFELYTAIALFDFQIQTTPLMNPTDCDRLTFQCSVNLPSFLLYFAVRGLRPRRPHARLLVSGGAAAEEGE